MKRGDLTASLIFAILAALAFYRAGQLTPDRPGLGDQYFNVPLAPLGEALSSIRTLGYPLFHAAMARAGLGLESYPEVQMALLILCTAIFALGLRLYGLQPFAALAAASPLLWTVPAALVMPETPAKCFALAAVGFTLWAAGTRSWLPLAGLAVSLFLSYQMRPAFLFLLVFLPAAWVFLYSRRWGFQDPRRWLGNGLRVACACALPLLLFCLLRLAAVGHFGLVSFAGQNTIGISIEMLHPDTVDRLPMEDRPLAMLLARAREGWPTDRFLTERGCGPDWRATAIQYAANVNRIGRATQAKFPPPGGAPDNVSVDKALSRMSQRTFLTHGDHYAAWLSGATVESARVAADLVLGGHGGVAFGLRPPLSIALALGLLALLLVTWPLERRAFGEGSRPYSGHAIATVALLAALFFLLKMLLVILVEPPLPRYVQAALFLVPAAVTVLYWERVVILAAALCGRPYWYSQCLVAYPPIPDAPRPVAWRDILRRAMPGKRGAALLAILAALGLVTAWWTTRDNRFFRQLEAAPDTVRDTLIASTRYGRWQDAGGATPLHYAARQGNVALVNHLLADERLRNATAGDGASPLHWAAMAGSHGPTTRALVEGGLSPDAPGPLGLSPVHLAALFGNVAALDALLDLGGDPDQKTAGYVAPLHLARSIESAALLLDRDAHVDIPDGSQATPFMWAHTRALAEYFLERGADVNARENWRSFIRQGTPLHKAVYQEDRARARWLLDVGADLDPGDINEFSPLFYALWRNNHDLVALLLDRGADIHHAGRWLAYNREDPTFRFTDIYGKTIGRHPSRDSFVRLVPDGATLRPLDWAAFMGNQALIRLLIDGGADPGRHNELGMSALHWAILANQGKAAKLLRALAPDPRRLDSTALPLAEFEAAVARGERDLEAPAQPLEPRAALREAARKVVDEYEAGAPNVLEGADGFLFTRQACTYLLQGDLRHKDPGTPDSGPSPAFASIVDVNRQLKARGIHLIVVPAPIAMEVHTDAFLPSWDLAEDPFPPRADFIAALNDAGVDAVDLLPHFNAWRKANPAGALYLREDGHWNSTAMGLAAEVLSERVRAAAGLDFDTTAYGEETFQHHVGLTPIAARLPEARQVAYRDTEWPVTRILQADGTPYGDDVASPILVAGDSYTLLFKDLSGHLGARLAAVLGRPVAALPGNAAGPVLPRVLARKGGDYIDAREVIVWVFSSAYIRPTGVDQWSLLELPGGRAP